MDERRDPVEIRLSAGALGGICDEMGAALVRSAHSANIKERRDCSTALFDRHGRMVMQAEHIPVHLGSMPASVEAVAGFDQEPGITWFLNDPFSGGSHLPDITVVTPVFDDSGLMLGFAANRAHHADVGGSRPGSMPADSTRIEDEGVVIGPRLMDEAAIAEVTAGMRQPDQRRADLRAQLAANHRGARGLRELAARHGSDGLAKRMESVIAYAEARTRAAIVAIPDGTRTATDFLEARSGDIGLTVEVTVDGDEIEFDFSGCPGPDEGNLNCPRSVTEAACFFAVRVLTDPDIPASSGTFSPVRVVIPEGSLLDAPPPHAVVAGNVETSSRVADLCLAAFGQAQGQGTMNNLTLGNEGFTYYETIGGGQGAFPDRDGPSATQVAMSNTLNTPIEALEIEFPLLATEYAVRRGTGGNGRHRGGDGIVRELEALEPMEFALLTERRRHAPAGAEGGGPGSRGTNGVLRVGAESPEMLEPKSDGLLEPGDRLRIETPGGGGHGAA